MSKRYTEGIAGDGAAILDNGTPITITEILNRLNDHDKLVKESDSLPDVRLSLPDNYEEILFDRLSSIIYPHGKFGFSPTEVKRIKRAIIVAKEVLR